MSCSRCARGMGGARGMGFAKPNEKIDLLPLLAQHASTDRAIEHNQARGQSTL